jgi:hypothetical protein
MRLRDLSIIQYQNVSEAPHIHRLWLSVDAFKKQIDYLATNDFGILSMDDAIRYMERKKDTTDGRPISLTFDNGYQDFQQHLFPLLSQYHFPATVLISPSKVGSSIKMGTNQVRYLSWTALRELAENNITIGLYEDYAWNINDIPENLVRGHIVEYKKLLEDRLGVEVCYMGVKEGVPNRAIRDLLISQGYRAFLTECPTNRKPDLFSVGRIQVDDDDFNIFLTKLSRTYLFFKDRKSWKYIREYSLDKVAHKVSETYDNIRGIITH